MDFPTFGRPARTTVGRLRYFWLATEFMLTDGGLVFNAPCLGDRACCEEEEEFTTELHGVRHGGARSFSGDRARFLASFFSSVPNDKVLDSECWGQSLPTDRRNYSFILPSNLINL